MPSDEIGLFEAIYTTRALRRFKPDPVPDDILRRVLDAAIRAPSGTNTQPWAFIVIKDPATKASLAEYYLDSWQAAYGERVAQLDSIADASLQRILRSADYLAHHLAEAPVLILVCGRGRGGAPSSTLPAVQNLMLAARGLGLGSVLTSIYKVKHEADVKMLLGIPDDWETVALIPLGYPRDKFGPVRRKPVEEVTFYDRWGNTPPW